MFVIVPNHLLLAAPLYAILLNIIYSEEMYEMLRPTYHFAPIRNWINDPNGLCFFGGLYHMFYQHYPFAPQWGTMHWGHAVSKDLCTWQELPIALFPTKDYDRDGVFSGSALIKDEKMFLYYTAVKYLSVDDEDITVAKDGKFEACQAMIISNDGMSFDNFGGKKLVVPVIRDEKLGHNIHTRDPKVWRSGDKYFMVLGTKVPNEENRDFIPKLLFYSSTDAENWELTNNCQLKTGLGNMWECPDIFPCPQWVLTLSPEQMRKESPTNNSVFGIIDFDNSSCKAELNAEDFRFIDFGLDYYAPQSFEDENGRRVQIGWLRFPHPMKNHDGTSWIGAMTMPRVVTAENGQIITRLHPNLEKNFIDGKNKFVKKLSQGEDLCFGEYRIKFDGENVTAVRDGCEYPAPARGDSVSLEIYIDGCIIETYINGGEAVISHVCEKLKTEELF